MLSMAGESPERYLKTTECKISVQLRRIENEQIGLFKKLVLSGHTMICKKKWTPKWANSEPKLFEEFRC